MEQSRVNLVSRHNTILSCPKCNSRNTFFLGQDRTVGFIVETWRCIACRKYFEKKYQTDAPMPTPIPPKPAIEVKKVEPLVSTKTGGCANCGEPIPEERLKRHGKTCSDACSKVFAQKRKNEYHVERKRKLAEKKKSKGINA